jgi:hypothetical protein
MSGHIERRGEKSWRIKFDAGTDTAGKRVTRRVTVRGTKRDAERKLTELLAQRNSGQLVAPSKLLLGDYLEGVAQGLVRNEPVADIAREIRAARPRADHPVPRKPEAAGSEIGSHHTLVCPAPREWESAGRRSQPGYHKIRKPGSPSRAGHRREA